MKTHKVLFAAAAAAFLFAQLQAQAVEEIITRHHEALGGRASLEKVERLELRGTTEIAPGQPPVPLIVRVERPAKYWVSMQLPAGEVLQLFDGRRGWHRTILQGDPGQWEPMEKAEEIAIRNRAHEAANPELVDIPLPGRAIKRGPDEDSLVISYKEGTPRRLWFEEGLIVREIGPDGDSRLADYKKFDGLPFATEIQTRGGFGLIRTRLKQVTVNPKFEPGQFLAK